MLTMWNDCDESPELRTMREAFPDWKTDAGGLFKHMTAAPWDTDFNPVLDAIYFSAHSGRKFVGDLITNFCASPSGILTSAEESQIAGYVLSHYYPQWEKKYALLSAEYNPVENYNMTETETGTNGEIIGTSKTLTRTGTETTGKAGTETLTRTGTETTGKAGTETLTRTGTETTGKTGTETQTHGGTDSVSVNSSTTATTENDIFGFNSSTSSPANEGSGTNTGSSTTGTTYGETVTTGYTNRSDTLTRNTTDKTEYANRADTLTRNTTDKTEYSDRADTLTRNTTDTQTGTDTRNGNTSRTLTRRGNIGVTTAAQMIQGELELWQWNFFENVFSDVDRLLTLAVY